MTTNVTPLRPLDRSRPIVAPAMVPVTALNGASTKEVLHRLHDHRTAETNRSAAVTGADSSMGAR
jgi:hypothetical protein